MWIKLDDGFATHPKILRVGIQGTILQIRALCYASQNKTDGFIPVQAIPILTTDLSITMSVMLDVKLWDVCEGGYQIHGYLRWNMSREEYRSMKEKLSKAGKKGMKSRWSRDNSGYKVGNKVSYNLPHNPAITGQSTSTDTLSSLNSSESVPKIRSNGHTTPKRSLRSISDDDKPSEKHFNFGQSLGLDVGPEWGKFKNYCLAHDKRYANFEAAFRNWLANANQMKGPRA